MASTTLEEKINKIRQKNEEIRRRHEEVEADKQNAAKLNALVKMVPPTDWPERKEPPEFSNPPPPRSNGNSKPKSSAKEYRGQQQQYHAGGGDGKKTHVFAEGDGPPPDPTYNFLADSEREERTREDLRENDRFRGRGGPLRNSSRRRGGGREGYSKEYRGSGAPKDASKPEYEAWRAERNRIDEARISRQRTAEGNWRREWDNNKINVEEDESGATKSVRLDIGDAVRKDHKEFDKWQVDGNDHDSPRGRGGKPYVSRGGQRGSHNNRVYQHSNSFEQYHGPVSPLPTKPPLSPNGIDDRMVVATDKSIKVIVNHGTTPPKGPVMSVKVSSSSIAGTGRVGPRQKPRVLYSSQSETEVAGHEHEKFSGYKSPDDKANRVSFNRDIEEQQRYAPKSPHPQRKAEPNSKSPYSTRKEFKYDSQQQRHGEAEPKSPYLQRKEIRDSPKSPHFQRKPDFGNRDSLAKQKSNNPGTDSFKPTHSQRRTSDKTKYDSQKFSGPRKPEDPSAPKPQRTNKRTDKSKNSFQHSNSKEMQKSNTNEKSVQPNDPATNTLEDSAKIIANGVKIHKEVDEGIGNGEKNSTEDAVVVETVKENQNEGAADVLEPNFNAETLNPSNIDLEKVDKSVPEDTKSIDQSETTIPICEDADVYPEDSNAANNETATETILQNVETNAVSESATPISREIKVEESSEKDLIVQNVETDAVLESITPISEESKVEESNEKELIVQNVETNTIAESGTPISIDSKADEVNHQELVMKNVESNGIAESGTPIPIESIKADKANDQELIMQNVETNGIAEPVSPISGESKAEECNVIVTDVKESQELPEITNGEKENVEIQTFIENRMCEDADEIKNIESISEDKPKDGVNSTPSTDAENLQELEEKIVATKSELQSDKRDEIPLELEKIANEMSNEEARNIVESTSSAKEVDASSEIETHQSVKEQILNNVDEQVVKDSKDKENPVI